MPAKHAKGREMNPKSDLCGTKGQAEGEQIVGSPHRVAYPKDCLLCSA